MKQQFIRRNWKKLSRLGAGGRKKKRKWKRPTGRDNKMREERKGYPPVVKPGYRKQKEERLNLPVISNVKDLEKLSSDVKTVRIGKMGGRKKYNVLQEIKKKGLEVENLNIEREINKIDKEMKERASRKSKDKKKEEKDKSKSSADSSSSSASGKKQNKEENKTESSQSAESSSASEKKESKPNKNKQEEKTEK